MAKRKEYNVVPTETGWAVKKNNAGRASYCAETKKEVLIKARQLSIKNSSEMIVHGKDGKIQSANSYGNDPCPPRDKK